MFQKVFIRREIAADNDAVFELNRAAFEDFEAKAVNFLRINDSSYKAWVAIAKSKVVAHIAYTKLNIPSNKDLIDIYGLAPMAVLPKYQNKGIGSKLVKESIKELQKSDLKAIFVLGHKDYYTSFGFKKAIDYGLYYKSSQFSEYFFVLELKPNYLKNASGEVIYNSVFDKL